MSLSSSLQESEILVGIKSDDRCVCVLQPKTLNPKKVLFRQNHMTSVLAVRQKAWMVFFIGTGDGQLIKVRIKSDMHLLLGKRVKKKNRMPFLS